LTEFTLTILVNHSFFWACLWSLFLTEYDVSETGYATILKCRPLSWTL